MRLIHQLCHGFVGSKKPGEKRADDEARLGSMLTVLAGKKRGGGGV